MTGEHDTVWVILTLPRDLEETVADWLLEVGAPGFSGHLISGHSGAGHGLSALERVSGRRRGYQFQIEMPAADAAAFLEQLRATFTGTRIRYAVLPVIAAGSLHR